ncbi:hypothetical protein BBD39_10665 [Arsenophonus endosymbiont of Bemisia tabaci Asia II 3]|nr:hypothetical protein BBD39_10665 [Arsenophonus endosymbiont of Bemisia tabaci Asia II 3]
MKKIFLLSLLLCFAVPRIALASSCDDVKKNISEKIVKNGVSLDAFKLEIVPTEQIDLTKDEVVGHCQNDKFKIVYTRLLHQ